MTTLPSRSNSNVAIETRSPYENYITSRSHGGNKIEGCVLPPIQEEDSLAGSQLLERIDSILEGVSRTSDSEETRTLTTSLEECHRRREKLHLPRALTALISVNHRKQAVTGKFATGTTLLERIKACLSSRKHADLIDPVPPELQSFDRSLKTIITASKKTSKVKDSGIMTRKDRITVWEVQPIDSEEIFGRVLFRFTTEHGACFHLKYKDAIELVEIINKKSAKSGCDVFYQVYAVDGIESSIVRRDRITELLQEMISKLQPPIPFEHGEELVYDNANVEKDPSTRGLTKHIHHYLNRRRVKKLIRRQTGISLGRVETSYRGQLTLTSVKFI